MNNNMVVLIGIVIMSVMSYCHPANRAKESPIFSNMVVSKDTIYGLTQEHALYRWAESSWNLISFQVRGEKIVAASDGTLYAIGYESGDCGPYGDHACREYEVGWVIYRFNKDKRWERVAILGGGKFGIKEFAVLDNDDFLILKDNGEIVRKTGDVWRTLN